MTNNNQVDWDEVPEDVEAVLTYGITESTFFKKIEDKLYSQCWRHSIYKKSGWDEYSEILDYFGDRFHLRPTPITEPTPEPPESTQVENSEVEATTTPEFDWSSVEDDVEAVTMEGGAPIQGLKEVEGRLFYSWIGRRGSQTWMPSDYYKTIKEREDKISEFNGSVVRLVHRPPATTPPNDNITCKVEFYEGELPEGMIPLDGEAEPPSICTILQEAQQSILKHHGVTGKVKFTVEYSE